MKCAQPASMMLRAVLVGWPPLQLARLRREVRPWLSEVVARKKGGPPKRAESGSRR